MPTFSQSWMVEMLRAAGLPDDLNDFLGKKFLFEFTHRGTPQGIGGFITGVSFTDDYPGDEEPHPADIKAGRHLVLTVSTSDWFDSNLKIEGLCWYSNTWQLEIERREATKFLGDESPELTGALTLF